MAAALIVGLITVVASGATIHRTYRWNFQGRHFSLTHGFSLERYRYFQALPRVADHAQYALYANEPHDDGELASLIEELEKAAQAVNLNVWEKLNLIAAFVQSIPYVPEREEYARYPLETLIDQRGDCEDSAILTAAILQQMAYPVVLLVFLQEKHIAVGISVSPPKSGDYSFYRYGGRDYYYLETTCAGWPIGVMPERYTSTPEIVSLNVRMLGQSVSQASSFGEHVPFHHAASFRWE